MNFKYKNIGIGGVAGCGKNTVADIIIKLLQRMGLPYRELSIAKNLKKEVSCVSRELYGIDSTNCTREEKDIIRPFLVSHGEIKRNLSNGRHWVEKITEELAPEKINIITDVRFNKYEKDEVFWLKKEINGALIHVSRYEEVDGERVFMPPANDTEAVNDPLVKRDADFKFYWKTEKNDTNKIISASHLLKWVKKLYV
jgi:dephospho-CoA kinase